MTHDEALAALDGLRDQVDDVDRRLLLLFNERARIVEGIGAIKKEMALPIYEPKREELVFQNVLGSNQGPLSQGAIRRLFERIIDESRTLQRERMAEKKEKPS